MSPRGKKQRIPRSERTIRCEKTGECLSNFGDTLERCNDAPNYGDYAVPASENICLRRAEEATTYTGDPYKRTYIEQTIAIDSTLANPHLNPHRLDERFRSIDSNLRKIIEADSAEIEANGRLSFHINARILQASLGIYFHRALRTGKALDKNLMRATHRDYVDILADFYDGPYAESGSELAYKRTELEVMTLLSRKMNPHDFPFAALFREESSGTHAFNHDLAIFSNKYGKTPVQVKTTGYHDHTGRRSTDKYSDSVVMAIHNDIVNLDFHDGELIIHKVEPRPVTPEEPFEIAYERFDPEIAVRWYAEAPHQRSEQLQEEPFEFVQKVGGHKRDGLIAAIVNESRGEQLSLDQRNLINAASHYLIAALAQVRKQK